MREMHDVVRYLRSPSVIGMFLFLSLLAGWAGVIMSSFVVFIQSLHIWLEAREMHNAGWRYDDRQSCWTKEV